MSKPKKQAVQKAPYEPTEAEQKVLDAFAATDTPKPKLKAHGDGNGITVDHPHYQTGLALLKASMGFHDESLVNRTLSEFWCILEPSAETGQPSEDAKNIMLATMQALAPQDDAEGLLAAQMAVTHTLTMVYAGLTVQAKNGERREIAEKGYNRLARTFVAQMEALNKKRSKGRQTVIVEQHHHYHHHQEAHLHTGGEAGGQDQNQGQPHERNVIPYRQAVPGALQANGQPVPEPSHEGLGSVPVSRRKGGSAKGTG